MTAVATPSSRAAIVPGPAAQSHFIGLKNFADFTAADSTNATEKVLLSPTVKPGINWNELIVSWNISGPTDSWIKVEAQVFYPGHDTKFYTMGIWSLDSADHPRGSVRHQRDADGTVNSDTLVMKRPGGNVRLRLTLGGTNSDSAPQLKFIGFSFFDTNMPVEPLPPNRAVWGKIVPTTERSQHGYADEKGWCSPTSVSMVLTHWSELLHRPEMDVDVPEVASKVYDDGFGGTGNWPFNTAYAGSFPGMRAYISRFSDISELEDWIAAGIPVIISARWDLLSPEGRKPTGSGHLTVCIGFTPEGDVVINDPATNLQKGQKVRHIYKRENVIKAWKESNNTVYLIYPETAQLPPDRFGHWEKER